MKTQKQAIKEGSIVRDDMSDHKPCRQSAMEIMCHLLAQSDVFIECPGHQVRCVSPRTAQRVQASELLMTCATADKRRV